MPNQTIDLWDGLEAWYDLDPRYYDDQRGVLADKSGYGRVAETNGSVSVGVEGPDSFQASGFSGGGSGDYINANVTTEQNIEPDGAQSAFALVRLGSSVPDNSGLIANDSGTGGFSLRTANSEFLFRLYATGSPNYQEVSTGSQGVDKGSFHPVFARYDGSNIAVGIGEEVLEQKDVSFTYEESNANLWVGRRNNDYYEGDIATVARWSRALSDAEITYLNNLTAPPRSL